MRKKTCSLVIFIFLCLTANSQQKSSKILTGHLSDYLNTVNAFGFSGAVLIAKGDRILISNGYGWSDEKKAIPITSNTFFDIASFVKAFTATAIMQLEERGKLKLTDTITKYFKDLPKDKSNITIHNLLIHTSGLVYDDFYDQISQAARDSIKDRDLYIKRILSFPVGYETGKGRSYSNTGFAILAAIIEIISGKSYEEYIRENLFKPAGMKETGYFIPEDLRRVSHGYNDGPTDYGFPWTTQWEGHRPLWDLMGNGGMLSTLDDMYKWAVALKGDKLINQESKDKMFTRYTVQAGQAYGWTRNEDELTKAIYLSKDGDAVPQGWNMDFRWYINENLLFIILSNQRTRAGSNRRPVMAKLVDIVLHDSIPRIPYFKTEMSKSLLTKYTGTYQLLSGSLFHISIKKIPINKKRTNQLVISAEGQDAIDLLYSPNVSKELSSFNENLNQKTKFYIDAVINNDVENLKTFFSGDTIQNTIQLWQQSEMKFGKLRNFKILGTSPLNQKGVQTFIKFQFEKSVDVYKITWRSDKIWDQEEDRLQPVATSFLRKSNTNYPLSKPFMSQGSDSFISYDFFKNRIIKVRFKVEKANSKEVIFLTEHGDVRAKKIK
ncbi:MAG: serine hydrolase domain-containing protein [Ferruginibacter sp.]